MSEPPEHNFDLLRKLIETDFPDRLSLFDQCAHRFRSMHPDDDIFQFLVATSFLTLVLRSVPEKIVEILTPHETAMRNATEQLTQAADHKLTQFEQAGELAARLNGQVHRLEAATAAHEDAIFRIKEVRQKNQILFWVGMLLVDALVGFLCGFLYAQHR
jgi:hypothetical protein